MKIKSLKAVAVLCALIAVLLAVFAVFGINYVNGHYEAEAKGFPQTVKKIEKLLPSIDSGVIDNKASVSSPSLNIDGKDYIGILREEKTNSSFPVFAVYDEGLLANRPACAYGSAQSGTLVIGGADRKGQFEFLNTANQGDVFYFTDVTGNRFAYSLSKISHLKTNDISLVFSPDYQLAVFFKTGFKELTVMYFTFGKNR